MIIFVTGTDTGVGKSYAVGVLARALREEGFRVITQKPVQTGASEPEDLLLHRRLMGLPADDEDLLTLTNPYLFSYPAAPETAAKLEGQRVSLSRLRKALLELERRYDFVLVEGAGGVYVPLNEEETFLDFFSQVLAPVIVVSQARLGTINHTVLTVEALKRRGLFVVGLVYNLYGTNDDFIAQTSLQNIKRLTGIANILTLPSIDDQIPHTLLQETITFLKPFLG